MYESKVSTVRSDSWGNFSVLKGSQGVSPANFCAVPCPTHPDYSITNICKSAECIEPLCPECITGHVELHEKTKKPAKIENIVNTRMKCIDKLSHIQEELQLEIKKYQQSCGSDLEQFLHSNRKKIQQAKNKIESFVCQFFQDVDRKMELLEVAYLNQREKKSKELKAQMAPLQSHFSEITEYKEELSSEEYIPALIELLNSPPKRPPTLSKPVFESFGEVIMNERAFQDLKVNLQSFLSVNSTSINQNQGRFTAQNSGGRFSNQMQFSRLGRSSSRELVESQVTRKNSNDSRISRENSRKKIFSKDKDGSQSRLSTFNSLVRPVTDSQRGKAKISLTFDSEPKDIKRVDFNYFRYDKGVLAYFPENENHFFAVDALCADSGFERFEFSEGYKTPTSHSYVITPETRVYIIGGKTQNTASNLVAEVLIKLPSYRERVPTKSLTEMNEPRLGCGSVYFDECLFVFGGRNDSGALCSCERYDLKTNQWHPIKSMSAPLENTNVVNFNDKILLFGGTRENGRISDNICIYYPPSDRWTETALEVPLYARMGAVQICKQELIIFGGQNQFQKKKAECLLLRQVQEGNYVMSPSTSALYTEATFGRCFVHRNSVLAIQNGEDNKHKMVMKLQNAKWRFLAC